MIKKVVALAAALAFVIQPVSGTNLAQAQQAKQQLHLEGLSRQASPAAKGVLFDPSDAVVLLLDHQTGLFQTVNDVPVNVLRANTVAPGCRRMGSNLQRTGAGVPLCGRELHQGPGGR